MAVCCDPGSSLQPVMTSEEEDDQEAEAPVKLMLIVLSEAAIQGFHEQVIKEQGGSQGGEGRGPHEAATLIQSSWRMRQARQELQRLRQQQETQAEAAAHQVLPPDMLHCTALSCTTLHCTALQA